MLDNVAEMQTIRTSLAQRFIEFAKADGVINKEAIFSDDLLLSGNVFLSNFKDRVFSVSLNWDEGRGHEAFWQKKTDVECADGCVKEFKVLSILIPYRDIKYREIWNLYKDWLILFQPTKLISSKLKIFDDHRY